MRRAEAYLQRECLVLVELDKQDGRGVVLEHSLHLAVKTPGVDGLDQVRDTFALNAQVWGEDVIPDLQRHGNHFEACSVKSRGKSCPEFTHVDDNLFLALYSKPYLDRLADLAPSGPRVEIQGGTQQAMVNGDYQFGLLVDQPFKAVFLAAHPGQEALLFDRVGVDQKVHGDFVGSSCLVGLDAPHHGRIRVHHDDVGRSKAGEKAVVQVPRHRLDQDFRCAQKPKVLCELRRVKGGQFVVFVRRGLIGQLLDSNGLVIGGPATERGLMAKRI